jgi:hypothetical protein
VRVLHEQPCVLIAKHDRVGKTMILDASRVRIELPLAWGAAADFSRQASALTLVVAGCEVGDRTVAIIIDAESILVA